MAKRFIADRIITSVLRRGFTTLEEVTNQFEVTDVYVHQLLSNSEKPLARTPKGIIANPGNYVFWSKSTSLSDEAKVLMTLINYLLNEYNQTHAEVYYRNAELVARKLVACIFELYWKTIYFKKTSQLPSKVEEDEANIRVNTMVKMITNCLKTGQPHVPSATEIPD